MKECLEWYESESKKMLQEILQGEFDDVLDQSAEYFRSVLVEKLRLTSISRPGLGKIDQISVDI